MHTKGVAPTLSPQTQEVDEKRHRIAKYREFDSYSVDIEVESEQHVHIPAALPSEPAEGLTYTFGATGFLGPIDARFCVVFSEWKNVNNYCHWSFTEVPFIHLALESPAPTVVLPDVLIEADLPFQSRWWDILKTKFSDKLILPLSEFDNESPVLRPVNHDTSSNFDRLIGQCPYTFYHRSRPTPYTVKVFESSRRFFRTSSSKMPPKFYIERTTRRLRNENDVQGWFREKGYEIIKLETLTLDEQVQLFSDATHIAGFHGAGLANLLFCKAGTHVVEIADPDCVYPCYKDGHVIPGKQATRTHFHMAAFMKDLEYEAVASENYILKCELLDSLSASKRF